MTSGSRSTALRRHCFKVPDDATAAATTTDDDDPDGGNATVSADDNDDNDDDKYFHDTRESKTTKPKDGHCWLLRKAKISKLKLEEKKMKCG